MRKLLSHIVYLSLLCVSISLAMTILRPIHAHAEEEHSASAHEVETLVHQARKGNAHAQYRLAKAYELGSGTRQSYREAVRWYTAAALQGLARAQFNLGRIFEEGRPEVKRDVAYALSWYEEAARNGLKSATDRLHTLTEMP
ncbi:MAG: sel1 repeat family protein [Bdellovibrionaceae bacterium]|nr:sel1 repeat family protein [Pseudobdellovibrionaceae bacterium]